MSRFNYGNNPQYPNPIYPNVYNMVNAPAPGQPWQAGQPPIGQPPNIQPQVGQPPTYPGAQYPNQPGFAVYPGQPQHGHPPAAMSYPGVNPTAPAPSAPAPPYGYPGITNITPTPTFSPTVEWIPSTPRDAHMLGNKAVVAGYEGYDGSPLWVIRARFEGDLIPGKYAAKHFAAYVPWGGNENAVQNIEVCCAMPDRVRWVAARDGVMPQNAIVAGNTSSGEPLYVGRAKEQGSLTPGKVHPSHRAMYLSFAGKEVAHNVYEVLCTV